MANEDFLAEQEKLGNVRDPSCWMMLKKDTAKFSSDFEGKTYYFCSDKCKSTFLNDPKKQINK